MSVPGTPGGQYVAMGLEHNEKGRGRWDQQTHMLMTQKRFRKMERSVADAPEPVRYGDPSADVGIVTWGSTTGTAIEALDRLAECRRPGRPAGAAHGLTRSRTTNWPSFMAEKRIVIVPEVNYSGQFANLLLAQFPRQIHRVNVYRGQPMRVDFLVDRIKDIIAAARNGATESAVPPTVGAPHAAPEQEVQRV